jgi:branched-chain amino acid transport system ATP-binding protein
MAYLTVDSVVAGYGAGPDILKGVSLEVELGQTYCIIGPNGAGKSTLLKSITGLLTPRKGKVIFKGEELNQLRTDQILQRGICFVPQDRSLFPDMTVKENLRMGGYVLEDQGEIKKRLEEVFQMFPFLKERSSQRAKTLSGGQQQMLAIGRTLVLKPELIMLDEPSLGLAPKIARQIFSTIKELKAIGITILLVEQNARMGLEIADYGVVLDLGKDNFTGPAKTILADPRIAELYLGKRSSKRQETSV